MADSGVDLGKKLGPMPVGVWLIVVAGGLGLAFFINRNQSNAPTPMELPDSDVGTGLVPAGAVIQTAPAEDVEAEDNPAWARRVTNWLIGQGHNAGVADNAVRKYIAGESLSLQEQALINLALVTQGAPPEALPPVTVPGITPTPTGAPQLSVTNPGSVRIGKRITFTGKATYGGAAPGSPQLVSVTGYWPPANTQVSGRRFILTNNAGQFTHSATPGIKGTRRTVFAWKGNIVDRRWKAT